MAFAELDTVVLTRDVPELGLRAGDVGAVVAVTEDALEIEFVRPSGETKALATLEPCDVRGFPKRHPDRPGLMIIRMAKLGYLNIPTRLFGYPSLAY